MHLGSGFSWQPPLEPNGAIIKYRIGVRFLSNDPTSKNPLQLIDLPASSLYSTVSGLEPYSNYEVYMTAFNSVGNVSSDWTIVQTGQSSPSGLQDFQIEKISSGTAVILRWDQPSKPNGVIVSYRIYEVSSTPALYQGLAPEFEFRRLQPYTEYAVQLEACTQGGCTMGAPQSFITAETLPSDQPSPIPGHINSTIVQISWSRPINPNGVISMYEVLRQSRTLGGIQKRSYSDPIIVYRTTQTDNDTYQYTDTGLQPYTEYQYSVRASNSEGSTQSTWQPVFTTQAAPRDLAPPVVSYVEGEVDKLSVKWVPPTVPNGIVQNYYLQRNDTVPLSFSAADIPEYIDTGLSPYTVYSYTIKACTIGGCTTSDATFDAYKRNCASCCKSAITSSCQLNSNYCHLGFTTFNKWGDNSVSAYNEWRSCLYWNNDQSHGGGAYSI